MRGLQIKRTLHPTPVALAICGMKLELINDLFQYVSKKLPNFYIAGWFYGRTGSCLRQEE
jgi:hypothetical protein